VVEEQDCLRELNRRAQGPGSRRSEVAITRRYFASDDPPERFVIAIIPPRE
jgi:hypothetical protein